MKIEIKNFPNEIYLKLKKGYKNKIFNKKKARYLLYANVKEI